MKHTVAGRPGEEEYAPFYAGYVSQVTEDDPLAVMEHQARVTQEVLRAIPEERSLFRYAPGKWSIREIAGHLADTERVMSYRALRFARADSRPLQGFDENHYVAHAGFDRIPLADLAETLADLRRATLALFRQLEPEAWSRLGEANGNPVTVRALAYIIPGHERHHLRVLRERYGA